MTTKIVIGLDGTENGERAIAFAKDLAGRIGACELLVVYVIEWSPFTFQTPEENALRHKRREEEIELATSRIVEPAVQALKSEGFAAYGIVRHGDVAETLNAIPEIRNTRPNNRPRDTSPCCAVSMMPENSVVPAYP